MGENPPTLVRWVREVFERCPQVKKQLRGGEFWTDGYYADMVGKHGNEPMMRTYGNGQTPPWAFTDIDHGLSTGIQLQGSSWGRKDDVVGLAGFVDGLSDADKNYLAAGGQGVVVGDGQLNYDPEGCLETYYNCKIVNHVNFTVDYQFFDNPGYNADRGPVNVFFRRGCTSNFKTLRL